MSQAASTTVDHARRTQHRRAGLLLAALAAASVDLAAKALAENHLIDTSVDLGVLWEHFVLNEIQAQLQTREIHYWRDKRKHEVDLVLVRRGQAPQAIE